jgi:hypothetical protein
MHDFNPRLRDGLHFFEEAKKLTNEFFKTHQRDEGRALCDEADLEGQYLTGAHDAQKHALRPEAIHAAIDAYEKTGGMRHAIDAALGKVEQPGNGC